MATPVSKSTTPLVFEALPALKVRHYCGKAAFGNIYTFARLYVLGAGLALSLCSFEEHPDRESRVAFCVAGQAGVLRLVLNSESAELFYEDGEGKEQLPSPERTCFSGQDEQGFYWGANLVLPEEVLLKTGLRLSETQEFCAALIKYRGDERAFGSAFPVINEEDPFDSAHFGSFRIVSY